MRTWIATAVAGVVALAGAAHADTYVRGYTRSNGAYVQPHYQTAPNTTKLDNYSTKGNHNPYTGKAGTVDPYKMPAHGAYNGRR